MGWSFEPEVIGAGKGLAGRPGGLRKGRYASKWILVGRSYSGGQINSRLKVNTQPGI